MGSNDTHGPHRHSHLDLDKVEERGKHLQSLCSLPTKQYLKNKYRVRAHEFPDWEIHPWEIHVWKQTVCAGCLAGLCQSSIMKFLTFFFSKEDNKNDTVQNTSAAALSISRGAQRLHLTYKSVKQQIILLYSQRRVCHL